MSVWTRLTGRRSACCRALAGAALALALPAATAQADDRDTPKLERVEVVGSHLKLDPSGNAIEVKAFADIGQLFAR